MRAPQRTLNIERGWMSSYVRSLQKSHNTILIIVSWASNEKIWQCVFRIDKIVSFDKESFDEMMRITTNGKSGITQQLQRNIDMKSDRPRTHNSILYLTFDESQCHQYSHLSTAHNTFTLQCSNNLTFPQQKKLKHGRTSVWMWRKVEITTELMTDRGVRFQRTQSPHVLREK